jgi:hypothetical protein
VSVKKRKATRQTANMIQTALWLPRDTHDRLKKAGGQRGLGEEIRRLIDSALEEAGDTPPDEITSELLQQLGEIARDLSRDQPLWADPLAYEAFRAAVDALLSIHKPRSEAQPEERAKFQAEYGDEDPQRVGRIMARRAQYAYDRERLGQAVIDKLKAHNKLKAQEE